MAATDIGSRFICAGEKKNVGSSSQSGIRAHTMAVPRKTRRRPIELMASGIRSGLFIFGGLKMARPSKKQSLPRTVGELDSWLDFVETLTPAARKKTLMALLRKDLSLGGRTVTLVISPAKEQPTPKVKRKAPRKNAKTAAKKKT